MHRLLILSLMTLCFSGGLVAPAFANEYCPSVSVGATQYCDCIVFNYATKDDAGVTITVLNGSTVLNTCGPLTVLAGSYYQCDAQFSAAGICGCQVTGDAKLSRTSLCVDPGNFAPLTCVPCK